MTPATPSIASDGFEGAKKWLAGTAFEPFAPVLDKWFVERLDRAWSPVRDARDDFFPKLLGSLGISYDCGPEDLGRVPASGAGILVCNHPMGLPDGVILGALLKTIRPDFRFLANSLLMSIPQLREYVIPVDPFGGTEAVRSNRYGLRAALEWLRSGGLLVVFPAGEVSAMQLPKLQIAEPEWNENTIRLARRLRVALVPVFIHGGNSAAFHAAGLVNPRLRTLLLPGELLNKAGRRIRVSVGNPIAPARIEQMPDARTATDYLRARVFALGGRGTVVSSVKPWRPKAVAPLASQQSRETIESEIYALSPAQNLLTHGEYSVVYADAWQIPVTLNEIGRLREETFRNVGEGTGRARDLDRFDGHYHHLILWNREKGRIAGAYRIGRVDEILSRFGARGLYTGTLFKLRRDFYPRIAAGLELGRSFVCPEFQKEYLPLLLLWKGLGHYAAAFPKYRYLFGPVSISQEYSSESRRLMVTYCKSRHGDESMNGCVRPRKTFRSRALPGCDPRNFSSLLSDLDELSAVVAEIESDRKGIPILLRQYLQMGGRILEFSVDKKFSSVLDGLIIVDLARTPRRQLDRYMGKSNAEVFLARHAA